MQCRLLEAVAWLALVAVFRRLWREEELVGRAGELCMWSDWWVQFIWKDS